MIEIFKRDAIGIAGEVSITVWDAETGKPTQSIVSKNRVVKTGRNALRDLVLTTFGGGAMSPSYIAIGTGATAVTDTDSALQAEVFRKAITFKNPLDSGWRLQLFLAATEANGSGTNVLAEVGLFTFSSGAPMWARTTHSTINKNSSVSVTYEWAFTLTAS